MATQPGAAKKMLTDNVHVQSSSLLDPKNAVSLDIHVISWLVDWVASNQIITKNFRDIGINSQVKLEPDWGLPERVLDEEPDPALAGGLARLAVRILLRQPVAERPHPLGQDGSDWNWHHFYDVRTPPQCMEELADLGQAAGVRNGAAEALPARPADHPVVIEHGGRRTRRSTSTASRPRRTSTPTRSSP